MRRISSGYTLLEIVVVLTLIGVIAGLAYPKIDVGRYKADAVVTMVRSVMQQAQRASLVSQHDVIVSFDVSGNRIRLIWDANNNRTVEPGERIQWKSLSSGNRFMTPPKGVRAVVASAVVGENTRMMDGYVTVTFHRDGSLSSDLEVYVATTATPTRWRAITVVQATGRTDWYRKGIKDSRWVPGVL